MPLLAQSHACSGARRVRVRWAEAAPKPTTTQRGVGTLVHPAQRHNAITRTDFPRHLTTTNATAMSEARAIVSNQDMSGGTLGKSLIPNPTSCCEHH